jgi:GNAT superfamily N-acetyltransferase
VTSTIAAAFAGDPAWAFLLGSDYERLASEFAGALFDGRAARGTVWVSDDLATVAMWDAPGEGNDQSEQARDIWARFTALAGEQVHGRLVAYNRALGAVAPNEPYWYLGVLATHPRRQREGLASAVLAPVLEEADRSAIACCLETSTEGNRRFYERRGFTEPTAVQLVDGPPTWWLCRRGGEPAPH